MGEIHGTLVTWKSEKGFGFIRPIDGGKDVFVHIRDFGNISRSPKVGDLVKFQPLKDGAGKVRAADVYIDGLRRHSRMPKKRKPKRSQTKSMSRAVETVLYGALIGGLIIVGINWYISKRDKQSYSATPPFIRAGADAPSQDFRCEGKEHCSQMTSCAEARFYLRSCPNTKMDGDSDGIPCESQWCN